MPAGKKGFELPLAVVAIFVLALIAVLVIGLILSGFIGKATAATPEATEKFFVGAQQVKDCFLACGACTESKENCSCTTEDAQGQQRKIACTSVESKCKLETLSCAEFSSSDYFTKCSKDDDCAAFGSGWTCSGGTCAAPGAQPTTTQAGFGGLTVGTKITLTATEFEMNVKAGQQSTSAFSIPYYVVQAFAPTGRQSAVCSPTEKLVMIRVSYNATLCTEKDLSPGETITVTSTQCGGNTNPGTLKVVDCVDWPRSWTLEVVG